MPDKMKVKEALELFDARPVIELVLLDYAMPGTDGLTVAREIKTRKPSVPIFIVSAHEATLSKMTLTRGSSPHALIADGSRTTRK